MAEWAAVVAKAMAARVAAVLGDKASGFVRRRLFGDPVETALRRALQSAYAATVAEHELVVRQLDLTFEFLQLEGSDELARVLIPGPPPDPAVLARAGVEWLASGVDLTVRRRREAQLVPVFRTFLDALAEAVAKEPDLDEAMSSPCWRDVR
jgi:hypothetical protein